MALTLTARDFEFHAKVIADSKILTGVKRAEFVAELTLKFSQMFPRFKPLLFVRAAIPDSPGAQNEREIAMKLFQLWNERGVKLDA